MPEDKPPVSPVPAIYDALVQVGIELAKVGIAKTHTNTAQGFQFRSLEDAMNVIAPAFGRHGVLILPAYEDMPDVDRVTGKGTVLIHARVRATYTFISAKDGSCVTVRTVGSAMDTGDKALNKAMAAALKYALLHMFLIPTEGTEDADASSPEESVIAPPEGYPAWLTHFLALAEQGNKAIIDAWGVASDDYRNYATKYNRAELDRAKERAAIVTGPPKKKAART